MNYINNKPIAILMATYNGEIYLKEQLESILSQSYTDWTLYIGDDGSSDNTLSILKEYEAKYDNIIIIKNKTKKGCKDNFLFLLKNVTSEFYMFADQDDVWLPNKIKESLLLIKENGLLSSKKPVLVHTNVSIVNKKLDIIHKSYWDKGRIEPELYKNLNLFPIIGLTQGCTMLFNHNVKLVTFPVSEYSDMHDVWIGYQVLRNKGVVLSLNTPTMYYRQHERNVCGVNIKKEFFVKKIIRAIQINFNTYRKLKKMNYGSFLKFVFFRIKIVFLKLKFKKL